MQRASANTIFLVLEYSPHVGFFAHSSWTLRACTHDMASESGLSVNKGDEPSEAVVSRRSLSRFCG